jgi:hypothetical protein
MAAFDAMSQKVRARLRESAFDFPPAQIAADVRRFRLDEATTLAFIDALEWWAREAASSAAAGNRREAQCQVGELVAAARAQASDSSRSRG